jgi:hypothetical protein
MKMQWLKLICGTVLMTAGVGIAKPVERLPGGPQVRIIPLAAPLKADDGCGQWMHPEYTAQDILEMIDGLKPHVLERYFTGKQNMKALVPVREGHPLMTVREFFNASMEAGAPGCIIIPKLNLTWISWGKEDYFWEAAENNYKLPLKRPIRITNLDNWKAFVEKHGEKKAIKVLKRLKKIGYDLIGVNMTGGYRQGYGLLSFADFPINSEEWSIRTSTLDKLKADPNIKQYYLYIDYPGQMDAFMDLSSDEQADVFTKVIDPAVETQGFSFVYPVLFDRWDANKHVTRRDGPYKGATMYEVIQRSINPDAANVGSDKLHLFILAGQSNMKRLFPYDTFTPAVEEAFRGDDVVVVRNAYGGVPIHRWYKDWKPATSDFEYDESRIGSMYRNLLKKLDKASLSRKSDSVTFVWMQGERDAEDGQHEVYAESVKGLIRQLKDDLEFDDINIVIGRLSPARCGTEGWDAIRAIQVETAESLERGAWVNTDDLPREDDNIHYTPEGYEELGRRFAKEAIRLVQNRDQ